MNVNDSLPAVQIASDALRFFGLPARDQVAIERACRVESDPVFFDVTARESNFFMGMACVFLTYKGSLLDEIDCDCPYDVLEDFSHRQDCPYEILEDFSHRLVVSMHNSSSDEWSEVAVIGSQVWEKLRRDACRAIEELGVRGGAIDDFDFDISKLINPSEFITTPEVKDILGP